MASSTAPIILVFKADAGVAKGKIVKIGTDSQHVGVCSAASDKSIGIQQNDTTTAGDKAEVALPGGGAKALAGGTIAAGDMLTSDGSGRVIATTSNADRYIAMALDAASTGDLVAVVVMAGIV